ncbi:family 20 glycosylhydrolase [Companilactobacillus jidongensis]|uniref:family 20 glycosylhydrolase n=1 Tax=Companilactobacillus jidongensis TaxID=2486006 RepID=UPI000F7B215B|nr:family 20 glycosylhydrolase [Companilactobacillus jidongensis]
MKPFKCTNLSATEIEDIEFIVKQQNIDLGQLSKITLCLTPNDKAKDEFNLHRSSRFLKITANSLNGLKYGLCELKNTAYKQVNLHYSAQLAERAVMIDCGRKYFSVVFFKKLIEEMFVNKFNTLQLHFSDNEGFRIESELVPEVVSARFLTKKEIRKIIAYAHKFGIQVIPELDSPGHLKQILSKYPQFQLPDSNGLNISDEAAVNWFKQILREYFELFSDSKYFHIGGDEFVEFDKINKYPQLVKYAHEIIDSDATGIDTYLQYLNQIAEFTKQHGFVPRVWNDGLYRAEYPDSIVKLSSDFQITYWTKWNQNMAPVQTFLDHGYKVINYNDGYFYHVLGEAASYKYPTPQKISSWQINEFPEYQYVEDMSSVWGQSLNVWCDVPDGQTEAEVLSALTEDMPIIHGKEWSVNNR